MIALFWQLIWLPVCRIILFFLSFTRKKTVNRPSASVSLGAFKSSVESTINTWFTRNANIVCAESGVVRFALITGSAGFVGRHLVDRLAQISEKSFPDVSQEEQFQCIICIDSRHTFFTNSLCINLPPVDITAIDSVTAVFDCIIQGFKSRLPSSTMKISVFHCAAIVDTRSGYFHDSKISNVNIRGTENLLQVCTKYKDFIDSFVHISSFSTIITEALLKETEIRKRPWSERDIEAIREQHQQKRKYTSKDYVHFPHPLYTEPFSTYARTKLIAEQCVLDCFRSGSLNGVVISPGIVYGVGDGLCADALGGAPLIKIHGSLRGYHFTTNTTSPIDSINEYTPLVYVKNLAEWLRLADYHVRKRSSNGKQSISGSWFLINNGDKNSSNKNYNHRNTGWGDIGGVMDGLNMVRDKCIATRKQRWPEAFNPSPSFIPSSLTIPYLVCRILCIFSSILDTITLGRLSVSEFPLLRLDQTTLKYSLTNVPINTNFAQTNLQWKPLYTVEQSFWDICSDVARLPPEATDDDGAAHLLHAFKFGISQSEIFRPLTLEVPSRLCKMRNRIVKPATFEAQCDSNGIPLNGLVDHHVTLAKNGVGLTIVAYGAVSSDGRSFNSQLLLSNPDVRGPLKKLTGEVHSIPGALIGCQITHAGYFADPHVTGCRPRGASSVFCEANLSVAHSLNLSELEELKKKFGDAARICAEVGFDCVELHCGHGYLLSQFLSPFTNRRTDKYGGPIENRMRFPLEVIQIVRSELDKFGTSSNRIALLVKFNLMDGFAGGLSFNDSIVFAKTLDNFRVSSSTPLVDMLVPSGGFVTRTGFFMLRGTVPLLSMSKASNSFWKKIAILLFGPFLVPEEKFQELFFLEYSRYLKENCGIHTPIMLLGGVCTLHRAESALRWRLQGSESEQPAFHCVGIGRALLRDPNLTETWYQSLLDQNDKQFAGEPMTGCNHCNICTVTFDKQSMKCVRRIIAKGKPSTNCLNW